VKEKSVSDKDDFSKKTKGRTARKQMKRKKGKKGKH